MLTVKKELENELSYLQGMKHDLFDNWRVESKERFEIVGKFVNQGLDDAISVIDQAIDRISELETELAEALEQIDELERESA